MTIAAEPRDSVKSVTFRCQACGHLQETAYPLRCDHCYGPMELAYDASTVSVSDSDRPLERYFDLMPLRSLENVISVGEGNTPCVHARALGEALELERLFLKDETGNPTRSTKDRTAIAGLLFFTENGIHEFAAASTGNMATAYAFASRFVPDVRMHLFCASGYRHRFGFEPSSRVSIHETAGDFVGAAREAVRYAKLHSLPTDGGYFNIGRRGGLMTAYLEAFDEMPWEPDFVFQSVSSGIGLYSAYEGARAYVQMGRLSKVPRLVAVQEATCAPMVRAFGEGASRIDGRHIVHHPEGIAHAILRGDPSVTYPHFASIVRESGGTMVDVTADEIVHMRELVRDTEGIVTCNAAAATIAATRKMRLEASLAEDDVVLVNVTGGKRE
jgi:threonine synthase